MDMTGKAVPVYVVDVPMKANEHFIATGVVNEQPSSLSVIRDGGEHFIVATVNNTRVAVSGRELLGIAATHTSQGK